MTDRLPTPPTKRLTPNRAHALTGQKDLDWFFKNRKWVRTARTPVVESCWATRPLPRGESALRILFLASKRNYKPAHDRNRVRRWLRAAVIEATELAMLEETMNAKGSQMLVMFKISRPLSGLGWEDVLVNVRAIAYHLTKRATPDRVVDAPLPTLKSAVPGQGEGDTRDRL